jgi:hypothetical protein
MAGSMPMRNATRRAELTREGKAMDGRKRAGSTPLGREELKAAQRGFAKRRFSCMVVSVMSVIIAARVPTPEQTTRATQAEKRATGSPPKPKM